MVCLRKWTKKTNGISNYIGYLLFVDGPVKMTSTKDNDDAEYVTEEIDRGIENNEDWI